MKTFNRLAMLALSMVSFSLVTVANAQSDVDLENEENRIGYAIGVNIAQTLEQQQILEGIEVDAFLEGLQDSISGDLKLGPEEMGAAIQTFMQRQQAAAQEQQAAAQAAAADNLVASEEFLANNSTQDGVVSLDSGLQYLELESGPAGGASPAVSDSVLAHYHGTLPDGSVFDSSVDRGEPATFGLSQVIAGWTEALQLMKVGDKWRLFIPPGLAYGEASPTPAIPPNSALIFDVELLEIR